MAHSAGVCWPRGGCTSRGQGVQVKSLHFPLQLAENLRLPYKNKVFRKQNGEITSSYEHFWLHTPQQWWTAKYFPRISYEFRMAPVGRQKDREHNRILCSILTDGWSLGTFRSQSEQLVRLGLRESAYKYRLPFPFSIFIDCHLLPASVLLLLYLLKAVWENNCAGMSSD